MIWYLDLCKELISYPNIIYVISKLNFDIIKLKFKVMIFDNQNIILDVTIYDIDIYLKWYLLWYPSLIFEFFWYLLNISFNLHHWTPHNFYFFHVQILKKLNFTSMNMVLVVLHSTVATLSCVVVQPHS